MTIDIENKARINWACRRGMRELDISIMPFSKTSTTHSLMTTKGSLFVYLNVLILIYLIG